MRPGIKLRIELVTALLCLAPAAASLVLAGGCSSPRPADDGAVHAKCPVCACEGDLVCVDVTVEPDTPRLEYQGTTYYFCSVDCLHAFQREPQEYVPGTR